MTFSKLARFLIPLALTALPGAALAKGSHPQTHHCKMPDGSMDMAKTHKQCTAAKGTWAKDAPSTGTGTAKPAPTPAPTPAPAPAPAPSK